MTGPPCPREAWRRRRYSGLPTNRPGPTASERRVAENRARRLARYEQVVTMRKEGASKWAIGQALHLDRRTVATWLDANGFPERRARAPRRRGTLLDDFMTYVEERHQAGVENAAELYRELRPRGYTGSKMTVRRALTALRRRAAMAAAKSDAASLSDSKQDQAAQPGAQSTERGASADAVIPPPPLIAWPPGVEAPSARQAVWLLRKPEGELRPHEQDYVELVCARIAALAEARRLALSFQELLQSKDSAALSPWLDAAAHSELRSFVHGIGRDRDAVLAAILFPWSNGQTEGQVNRIKAIKRTMYGRAK